MSGADASPRPLGGRGGLPESAMDRPNRLRTDFSFGPGAKKKSGFFLFFVVFFLNFLSFNSFSAAKMASIKLGPFSDSNSEFIIFPLGSEVNNFVFSCKVKLNLFSLGESNDFESTTFFLGSIDGEFCHCKFLLFSLVSRRFRKSNDFLYKSRILPPRIFFSSDSALPFLEGRIWATSVNYSLDLQGREN